MNLPLMSPAELDNAVYKLIAKKLGTANAMRFIARHHKPDGIDYTRDRHEWLTEESDAVDRLFKNRDKDFERLVTESRRKSRDRSKALAGKNAKK